tara:strand:- start:106 stop:822 length:717 start_codon:yes stop_codon:yes gene_type:complete
MSKNAIKRIINKDLKEIRNMNLDKLGIHIIFNEENMLNAKAILIGPQNTPFENGILYFTIDFPIDYPFSPPKILYYSTSRYRIHPNLYVGRSKDNFLGKVCLSIINTWSGPKWTSVQHVGSVLLSIQSLLCENPLHNEPGFENENSVRNDTYNKIVLYDTFKHLILHNYSQIPENFIEFQSIINKHIIKNRDTILNRLNSLEKQYPQVEKINLNIYNLSVAIDYKTLNKLCKAKLNLI